MKKVKKIIFIIIIVLILGTIWVEIYKKLMIGTILEAITDIYKYSKDNRNSSEMVLNYMEERYGEKFYYSRNASFGNIGYKTHIITCNSLPGKEIKVELHGLGQKEKIYKDEYLVKKYEDDIKKMIQDISLNHFKNVLILGVADNEITSGELSAQASLKDVFADEEFCLSTFIVLKESEVTSKDTIDNMLYEIFKEPLFERLNEAVIRVEVLTDDVYAKLELDENADWDKSAGPYCAIGYKETNGNCYIDWIIINKKELEFVRNVQKIGEKTTNDWNTINKLSDRWEDCEFLYDNKKIKLMSNSIGDVGQLYISERETNYMIISKLDIGEWSVLNNSEEIKSILECEIYGIEKNYEENPSQYNKIQLSKGITWKLTMEDIVNAYGEPKEKEIMANNDIVLSYEANNGSSMKLKVDPDFGLKRIEYFLKVK